MQMAGVSCVVAKTFARIFYRNAINVGLVAIQCDTDDISTGDELEVNLEKGEILDRTTGMRFTFPPLPLIMRRILEDGGLLSHIRKHKDFQVE